MNKSIIFTDASDPKGKTIHYIVNKSTRQVAAEVRNAYEGTEMLEVLHNAGADPIFVNPDNIVSITPAREED